MRITAHTSILVRAVVADDKKQAQAAARLLKEAELIAVTLPCLCEFVWVLRRVYQFGQENISTALEALLCADNVAVLIVLPWMLGWQCSRQEGTLLMA